MAIDKDKGPGGIDASYGRRLTSNKFDTTRKYDTNVYYRDDGQLISPSGDSASGGVAASKFLAGLESARAGVAPLIIALPGDSNTSGAGSGSGAFGMIGARLKSPAAVLAAILALSFGYTTDDAFFGDQNATNAGVTVQQYDPRFDAFGAGWAIDATASTYGGRMIIGTSGGAGAFGFTPRAKWDTVKVFFGSNTSTATAITAKAAGTSFGTINTRGAGNQLYTQTLTTGSAAAVQKFTLDTVTGGNCFMAGAVFWDSANPGTVIVQGGWFGAKVSNFVASNANPWGFSGVLAGLAPKLTIYDLTINDSNQSTTLASFMADSTTLLTPVAAYSDLIIAGGTPSSGAGTTNGLLQSYLSGLDGLRQTLGSPFALVDWRNQFGASYTVAQAAGYMYDTDHVTGPASARKGSVLAGLIKSIKQQA